MPLWETSYLERLQREALEDIAKQCMCVVDRYAFPIRHSFALYQVPKSFLGVRFIRWKGKLVRPLSNMEARYLFPGNTAEPPNLVVTQFGAFYEEAFQNDAFQVKKTNYVPNSENLSQAEPEFYCFSGTNWRTLQFYGVPSTDVPSQTTGLWDVNIPNCVILEFYRLPDELNDHIIPAYFKREICKNYVLSRAFAKEGPGQRPDLANYYSTLYNDNILTLKEILKSLYRGTVYEYSSIEQTHQTEVPRARYPLNYGIPFYI